MFKLRLILSIRRFRIAANKTGGQRASFSPGSQLSEPRFGPGGQVIFSTDFDTNSWCSRVSTNTLLTDPWRSPDLLKREQHQRDSTSVSQSKSTRDVPKIVGCASLAAR